MQIAFCARLYFEKVFRTYWISKISDWDSLRILSGMYFEFARLIPVFFSSRRTFAPPGGCESRIRLTYLMHFTCRRFLLYVTILFFHVCINKCRKRVPGRCRDFFIGRCVTVVSSGKDECRYKNIFFYFEIVLCVYRWNGGIVKF